MTVYLLHFDEPISPDHPARHYLGFTDKLRARMETHARGNGARLVQVAAERGIGWELVRTWPGAGRGVEHWLKQHVTNSRELCPVCNPGTRAGLHVAVRACEHPQTRWFGHEPFHRDQLRRPGLRFRHPA